MYYLGVKSKASKAKGWKKENVGKRDKRELGIDLSNLHDPILIFCIFPTKRGLKYRKYHCIKIILYRILMPRHIRITKCVWE